MDEKQLLIKLGEKYKDIFPINYIKNIYNDDTKKYNLVDILKHFNHFYITFKDDKINTRLSLPVDVRRPGVYITYIFVDKIITEVYKGTAINCLNDSFADNENWYEDINEDNLYFGIKDKQITLQMLDEQITDLLAQRIEGHLTIYNFPDEEDITSDEELTIGGNDLKISRLRFKDRNPSDLGKGYVILRQTPNMILTSANFDKNNTTYEIRYNYDLNGATIGLPKNATLFFNGGSINNGSVIFDNGTIIGTNRFDECGNASFTGKFAKGLVMYFDDLLHYYNGTEWKAVAEDIDLNSIIIEKTVTVYTSKANESDPNPNSPVGGFYDYTRKLLTPPDGWFVSGELTGIIYQSTGTFNKEGNIDDNGWSEPIRISGYNGKNGVDGASIEFIYKRTTNNNSPDTPENNINNSKFIPEGWEDHPLGVDEVDFRYEWMCTRTIKDDGTWNDWIGPVIWASYGVNGKDGDGIEYIYTTTYVGANPEEITDNSETEDNYIPSDIVENSNIGVWKDEPLEVDSVNRWQWVSTRKYKDGKWSNFSIPKLWGMYGIKGDDGKPGSRNVSMYTVTDRSDVTPPVEADFRNPGSIWSEVLIGYDNRQQIVWEITGVINSDNELVGTWQGPLIKSGSDGVDGSPGIDGIPGGNYEKRYCLGTNENPNFGTPAATERNPLNWSLDRPIPTEEYPYIWCIEAAIIYTHDNTETGIVDSTVGWGTPFIVNGVDGKNGSSKLIYPAGTYNPNSTYVTDENKAVYVLDDGVGKFYVLEKEYTWIGTEHNNRTPSVDIAAGYDYWKEIENLDIVYANIGMFNQALVGNAVFYKQYMFSQQGVDVATGNITDDYINFNFNDPYGNNATWKPNLCFNLLTGDIWFKSGDIHFTYRNGFDQVKLKANNNLFNISDIGIVMYAELNTSSYAQFIFNNSTVAIKQVIGNKSYSAFSSIIDYNEDTGIYSYYGSLFNRSIIAGNDGITKFVASKESSACGLTDYGNGLTVDKNDTDKFFVFIGSEDDNNNSGYIRVDDGYVNINTTKYSNNSCIQRNNFEAHRDFTNVGSNAIEIDNTNLQGIVTKLHIQSTNNVSSEDGSFIPDVVGLYKITTTTSFASIYTIKGISASISRTSVGTYSITFNSSTPLGFSNCIPFVNVTSNSKQNTDYTMIQANTNTFDNNVLVINVHDHTPARCDCNFVLMLIKY